MDSFVIFGDVYAMPRGFVKCECMLILLTRSASVMCKAPINTRRRTKVRIALPLCLAGFNDGKKCF